MIGLAIGNHGAKTVIKAKKSERWEKTEAVIVSSQEGYHGNGRYQESTKSADVAYEYYAKNELRSGGRILFGDKTFFGDSEKVDNYLEKYKEGNKVVVYYNPFNPDESVLEPGIHTVTWVECGFAFVFILFGTIFILVGAFADTGQLKKRKSKKVKKRKPSKFK